MRLWRGFAPSPAGGIYSALPGPLAGNGKAAHGGGVNRRPLCESLGVCDLLAEYYGHGV